MGWGKILFYGFIALIFTLVFIKGYFSFELVPEIVVGLFMIFFWFKTYSEYKKL